MTLREFISTHRDEILALCVRKLKQVSPERSEEVLADNLAIIIDEIVRALAHEEGLAVSSPLPGASPTAAQHGRRRKQLGYEIEKLARDFGSISDATGELGAKHGLSFRAEEYRIFNTCIDSAISAALESYWNEAQAEESQAVTERIGFLAHELRNALASAQMALSIMAREHLSVQSRTGAVLRRGLSRAESLVGQALLEVQLRAGVRAELRPRRIAELLHDIEDSTVLERGVQLKVEADDALKIDCDDRLLTSAVSNLVQNAVKFTHRGGTIVLRAHGDAAQVVIEVEDECGGLPPGKDKELFEPFVQRGSDRRGVGLGLSITQEAIAAHGGTLSVRNLPGKGCIFVVLLRRSTAG